MPVILISQEPEHEDRDENVIWSVLMKVSIDFSFSTFGADMELMKERFAKLLLGEDMSGGGKGVSSALALSNAITNLAGIYNGKRIAVAKIKCLMIKILTPVLHLFCVFQYKCSIYFRRTKETRADAPGEKSKMEKRNQLAIIRN